MARKSSLHFVDYPSEVHLQDGLVCLEKNTGILYSADLFLRFGNGVGKTIDARWEDEVATIEQERVPNEELLEKLKADLSGLAPRFVAVAVIEAGKHGSSVASPIVGEILAHILSHPTGEGGDREH